jgi:hypothetical protein
MRTTKRPPVTLGRLVLALVLMGVASAAHAQVTINEIKVKSTEYVELYNAGGSAVDVTGWTLNDGGTPEVLAGSVPAGGFLVIATTLPLSNSGAILELRDLANVLIDDVGYGNSGGAPLGFNSIGRSPDGADTDDWARDFEYLDDNLDALAETPGAPNRQGVPALGSSILINELDPFGTGQVDLLDRLELYNPTGSPIDVQGYWISDGDGFCQITNSIVIPAGGWAVLTEDAVGEGMDCTGFDDIEFGTTDVAYVYSPTGVRLDQVGITGTPTVSSGQTLQRCSDGDGPNDGFDYASTGGDVTYRVLLQSEGVSNTPGCLNQPPAISNVLQRPLIVEPAEAVTITADVVDSDGTVSAVRLYVQVNGGGFTFSNMVLGTGDTYTGTIAAGALNDLVEYYIEAEDNLANTSTSPADAPTTTFSYTVQNEVITSIADIHADTAAFAGSLVVVQGQVYCPGNYQMDGSSVSAYIQDGSNRGINIFGTFGSTGFGDLNDTGNIVKVTGTVTLFFTTVEITDYDVELISSGNTPLSPTVQATVADAASPDNEGTYIQSSGVVQSIEQTGGTNPATNFSITDCGGTVIVRVDADLLPQTLPVVGDSITASGAGATFQTQGQILVCSAAELVNQGFVGLQCPAPILITEIMRNPGVLSDPAGEWFEIQNVSGSAVDIEGWTIRDDGTDLHVIASGGPLLVEPGAYEVLGNNADSMATQGVTLFYTYANDVILGNGSDELVLEDALGVEVNRIEWSDATFPDAAGASMQWDGTGDNGDGCLADPRGGGCNWYGFGQGPVFGDGDRGTPGAPNVRPSDTNGPPAVTQLHGNIPNPFNPITTFSFSLHQRERASLVVYDVRGKRVRTVFDEVLDAGRYSNYTWDGRNDAGRRVNSGIYFYKLETASGFAESRKMTILK